MLLGVMSTPSILIVPALLCAACATADTASDQADAFPTRTDGSPAVDATPAPDANGTSACDLALQSLSFGFEGSAQGFVHDRMPEVAGSSVNWTFDHWEQGSASGGVSCAAGECFGTNLAGNYIQCQRAYLVSPPIDLSACAAESQDVSIFFEHRFDFWTGSFGGSTWFDGGLVEISADGTSWQPATLLYPGTIDINPEMTSSYSCVEKDNFYVDGKDGYVGSSGGWKSESFVVPAALATVTFQMRFVYSAGVSSQTADQAESMNGTAPGWYVDSIRLQ